MFKSLSKWIYDNKPTYALKYEEPLAELKTIVQDSGSKIFQDLLQEYFLNNTHRVTTHLYPVANFDAQEAEVRKLSLYAIFVLLNHHYFYVWLLIESIK